MRQPLPRPVIAPSKPQLQLGLDVQLEFIMAAADRDWERRMATARAGSPGYEAREFHGSTPSA